MENSISQLERRCPICNDLLPFQHGRGRTIQYCPSPKGCSDKAYRMRKREFNRTKKVRRNKPHMDLIFCAGGNREFFQVAFEAGYMLGLRSGYASYNYRIDFVDNEYKRPQFEKHLKVVIKHQPKYATVPDLSGKEVASQDIERAMHQYNQLSRCCQIPLIIPKHPGQIAKLPPHVAIGYSVPTTYGDAGYDLWELQGRKVHLLGGSPLEQMKIFRLLSGRAQIISADGNMAMGVARNFAQYWDHGWIDHPEKGTPDKSLYLECWSWSCANIWREWEELVVLQSRQLALI